MRTARICGWGSGPIGGSCPRGGGYGATPPVNRLTDHVKHYLPTTSFVGGNKHFEPSVNSPGLCGGGEGLEHSNPY